VNCRIRDAGDRPERRGPAGGRSSPVSPTALLQSNAPRAHLYFCIVIVVNPRPCPSEDYVARHPNPPGGQDSLALTGIPEKASLLIAGKGTADLCCQRQCGHHCGP